MSTPQEITDAAAAGPASASVDGRSGTQHSLRDLIELEKWRANQTAANGPDGSGSSNTLGVKFFRTSPQGAL